MSIPYILTPTSLTLMIGTVPQAVPQTHPNYNAIVDALRAGSSEADIKALVDVGQSIIDFTDGAVEVRDGQVYLNGVGLDTQLTRRIVEFMRAGQEGLAQPLINFINKVIANPSRRAVLGLYDWLEKAQLPIHPDGDILAWKIVNDDYTDCYSGKFDNSIGKVVEVPRWNVDEDADRTCSYGLHFCSTEYLPHYGPANKRVVVVKINPADVVAFPRDYNTSKGRCCRYTVIGEVPADKAREFFGESTYVYDGFDADETPTFEVGQRWKTRDGQVLTIVEVDTDGGITYPVEAETDNGSVYTFTLEGRYYAHGEDDGWDLIELVPESELPVVFDYQLGDAFKTRDGKVVTVKALLTDRNDDYVVQMSDGWLRTESGRFLTTGADDSHDLVDFVPSNDNAIDVTKPIISDDGEDVSVLTDYAFTDYTLEYFARHGITNPIAVTYGNDLGAWFFNADTGKHIYGIKPDIRNAA